MERFYPESKFGGFTRIDGTIAFYTRVQALVDSDCVVIDFGCGRGAYVDDPVSHRRGLRIFQGKARRVIGLDASSAGSRNPFLDEFRCLQGPRWPIEDGQADVIVCDNVLEHLPDPAGFFSEAYRVLCPGGSLCIRTPNLLNYVALLSRIIPNRRHAQVLAKAKPGVKEEDIFPTLYRCNTIPAVRRALARQGFSAVVYGYEAEPSYLSFSSAAYALGVLHQKLAPGFFKAAIFAFARK
ncbi:MAG: class I SAM-dependent methyltransferase [Anaerolineaceae bacterium]|nr:class I SAM-dependent methyltransferase [Anaerolineaceae bacterium]